MNRIASRDRGGPRVSGGFTLVEVCICAVICALLAGLAMPSLDRFRQEQQLRASAEVLGADLRLARAEAVRQGRAIFFRVSGRGAGACYVLYTGAKDGCDCRDGEAVCLAGTATLLKAAWFAGTQPVRISSNVETLQFQHAQGLVSPAGSIELRLDDGNAIRHVVAITGRIRSCHVDSKLGNMRRCG